MSTDAPQFSAGQAAAGHALYSKLFLSVYDVVALGFNCRFVWRCPSNHMLDLYNLHVSANHLDIGVGTGYFVDRCTFPRLDPRIALMDPNLNCLEVAGKRLRRYAPETYVRSVLEPITIDAPAFDSISMLNVLHCLPGNMNTKGVALGNVKALLNPGGVLFGSTILGKGVKMNLPARYVTWVNCRMGSMSHKEDDLEGLQAALEAHFAESSVEVIGSVALFRARL
jgi:ubiquinone/menaquinone biosynthesis C-methylase UbiE